MKSSRLIRMTLVVAGLLLTLVGSAGAAEPATPDAATSPTAAGCASGPTYDPACDVNHDDTVDVVDLELTASHWGQGGVWTSGSWELAGNSGTTAGTDFLGTTDNQPLELHVNGVRALRLEPAAGSPNLIGGYSGNGVSTGAVGATVAGGGAAGGTNRVTDNYGVVSGGLLNRAGDDAGSTSDAPYATVGGGYFNAATGIAALVGGGSSSSATANYATVGGGVGNEATYFAATISGGSDNEAAGSAATVGGGQYNHATGHLATVPGGLSNTAQGNYSFAAGRRAKANHQGAFVWADSTDADFASTANDQFSIRADGGVVITGTHTFGPMLQLTNVGNGPGMTVFAGTPTYSAVSGDPDGLQVFGAQGSGLFVGHADLSGVDVFSASTEGIRIGSAGTSGVRIDNAAGDAVSIVEAGDDGAQIGDGTDFPSYGVYVPPPGVPHTALLVNTANSNGQWALSTPDKISASNVTAASVSLVAVADGSGPLTPGDLVAATGATPSLPNTETLLPQVRLADAATWAAAIGVVESRMALQPVPGKMDSDGQPIRELRSVPGPAKAGDYVALTVLGVAQVKIDATADSIVAGQRLTAAEVAGHARALRTKLLDDMVVAEGAPTIGIALATPDRNSDTVPVYVTLR